ncbi:unnamed protein product [Cyprideis torosa]|uniref:Uncharacterized protein n=1 Tax=Cyprideis torosa TaxID=163714 RepID=A0A7R8WP21_9CRUS|nr:unnamed protein product [Cyprideis torosa]CAG0904643.1 unnamed protein product [Cyprideis torosa]
MTARCTNVFIPAGGEKPYKCSFCAKSFIRKTSRQVHERLHTGGGRPYKCSFCKKSFRYIVILGVVHKRGHTSEKPYKCSTCEKGFARSDRLHRHERGHFDKKSTSTRLWKRIQFSNQPQKKMANFNDPEIQYDHHGHLSDNQHDPLEEEQIMISSSVDEGSGGGPSANTSKQNSEQNASRKNDGLEKEDIAKSLKSQSDLPRQQKAHTTGEELYECQTCSWKFCSSEDLELHSILHTVEGPSKCPQCEKPLESEHRCQSDESFPLDGTLSKCKFCSYTYTTLAEQREHESIHTGKNAYTCTYSFTHEGNCKAHERRHTDKKPYKCSVCEEGFSTADNMKKHQNKKHADAEATGSAP